VLDALGIEQPILVGHSLGGMLAAEMAALEPGRVSKLVLVAPAGLYLEDCPTMDFFAMKPEELMAAAFYDSDSAAARAFAALPADKAAAAEVMVRRLRGFSAAARFLWPLGDRGLSERLYRVKAPTLLMGATATSLSCRDTPTLSSNFWRAARKSKSTRFRAPATWSSASRPRLRYALS
jgi:pimeloyl-ACP methyl ester carboxylesterase